MCGIICLIDTMQTKIRIGFIHKKKGTTMDIINIAICDDNSEHISILEKYLFEISSVKIECDAYHSGESLVMSLTIGQTSVAVSMIAAIIKNMFAKSKII